LGTIASSDEPVDATTLVVVGQPAAETAPHSAVQLQPAISSAFTGWSVAIGSGGMGEVWLARRADGLFDAPVALKLMHMHLAQLVGARALRPRRPLSR
jgi:hypothetical protein